MHQHRSDSWPVGWQTTKRARVFVRVLDSQWIDHGGEEDGFKHVYVTSKTHREIERERERNSKHKNDTLITSGTVLSAPQ